MATATFTSPKIELKQPIVKNSQIRYWNVSTTRQISHSSEILDSKVVYTQYHKNKSHFKTASTYSSLDYGSKKRAKIFDYIVTNFSYSKNSINKIIRHIYRNNISVRIIDEYAKAADEKMTIQDKSLVVLKDDFSPESLYLDIKLSTQGDDFLKEFDQYIDDFLVNRNPDFDKVNVTVA